MRLLVCGGRDYQDRAKLYAALDSINERDGVDVVIHGAARGADTLAQDWADDRGVCCLRYAANWRRDGKAAGPIRNKLMLDDATPDHVMAFPGGRGTANMIEQARKLNVPVTIIEI